MTPSAFLLLRFVVLSGPVSRVVVSSCVRAWSSLFVDIASVACRPTKVMSMCSESYHIRDEEMTDLLGCAALSLMDGRVIVLNFGRTALLTYSQSVCCRKVSSRSHNLRGAYNTATLMSLRLQKEGKDIASIRPKYSLRDSPGSLWQSKLRGYIRRRLRLYM